MKKKKNPQILNVENAHRGTRQDSNSKCQGSH